MTRRWHVEHADGRRWTPEEFDAAVVDARSRCRWDPVDMPCDDYAVDSIGVIYLIDEEGMAWSLNERRDDARVVWDG